MNVRRRKNKNGNCCFFMFFCVLVYSRVWMDEGNFIACFLSRDSAKGKEFTANKMEWIEEFSFSLK